MNKVTISDVYQAVGACGFDNIKCHEDGVWASSGYCLEGLMRFAQLFYEKGVVDGRAFEQDRNIETSMW